MHRKAVLLVLALGLFWFGLPMRSGSAQAPEEKGEKKVTVQDFKGFTNVEIKGADLSALKQEKLDVLYQQARYCQAMTDADIDTMRDIVSEEMVFVHMSGMRQSREEYFADVADGSLDYTAIGIENPVVTVNGDRAEVGLYRNSECQCVRRQGNVSDERRAPL